MNERGRVGMICLIVAESSLFAVFVVAYLFYIGKSLNGPYPKDVLELPIFNTVCLLSSSVTIAVALRALRTGATRRSGVWFLVTVGLGASHVIVGLVILSLLCVFSFSGALRRKDVERAEIASWYWHFVDGVWIVVFTVVYLVGR